MSRLNFSGPLTPEASAPTFSSRLDNAIAQVESHDGKIIHGKHQIGEHGFRTVILVSEGNRIALHSL